MSFMAGKCYPALCEPTTWGRKPHANKKQIKYVCLGWWSCGLIDLCRIVLLRCNCTVVQQYSIATATADLGVMSCHKMPSNLPTFNSFATDIDGHRSYYTATVGAVLCLVLPKFVVRFTGFRGGRTCTSLAWISMASKESMMSGRSYMAKRVTTSGQYSAAA